MQIAPSRVFPFHTISHRCRKSSRQRGQYDDRQGSDDVLWQRQVAFKNQWQGLHLFSDTTVGLKWNYVIPSFMLHS